VSAAERGRMEEEVREIDFPIALRGYDRAAVDRYVQKVNRLIAELELSASPESAVRHALEEVSEETSGLLQRAYETAEEITARSRAKADDRLQQAEQEAKNARSAAAHEAQETRETAQRETRELREAAERDAHELRETAAREAQQVRATTQGEVEEMRAAAETRVRELDRNAEAISRERRRFIDDMRTLAQQQFEIADAAAARFPGIDVAAEESSRLDPSTAKELGAADKPTAAPPVGPEQI
jgi:DivIVA domain-containing protein